jgi:hypothetical protein
MNTITITAALLLALAPIAHAQPLTDSFTYQGELMDAGQPANGVYDIAFNLWDSETGGAQIPNGGAFVADVMVIDGRFQCVVDFGPGDNLFATDQTRWFDIRVREDGAPGGFTTLAPRQRITPAPYATHALNAQTADFATTSSSTLQDVYDNGSSITMSDETPIEISSTVDEPAFISLLDENGSNRAWLHHDQANDSGRVTIFGPQDQTVAYLGTGTGISEGGYLYIARTDTGGLGAVLRGDSFDGGSLTLSSQINSMTLSAGLTGDQSVNFPVGAINSQEIFNEPGVAETANSAGSGGLTPNPSVIDILGSTTLNCPSNGYVIVIASAEVAIPHTFGLASNVALGVSMSSTSIPPNGDLTIRLDESLPLGDYEFPVTPQAIFPVSAGSNTFYLLGDQNHIGSFASVSDIQISALFVATAYGSVARLPGTPNDDQARGLAPLTPSDIIREQNAALRADLDRQQRELDAMRAEMDRLRREIEREP